MSTLAWIGVGAALLLVWCVFCFVRGYLRRRRERSRGPEMRVGLVQTLEPHGLHEGDEVIITDSHGRQHRHRITGVTIRTFRLP